MSPSLNSIVMKVASITKIYGFWSFRIWIDSLPIKKDLEYYQALEKSTQFKMCLWTLEDGFQFF